MTITEKILARASGKQKLSPDDVMFAKVDKVMLHDVSGPGVIKVFSEWEKKRGLKLNQIWDPDRVWVAEDHFVPSADRISAENISNLSNFTKQYGITKHFSTVLVSMGFAIHFHMKRPWCFLAKSMLEVTRIQTPLVP
jgi:3-isopropylmalate/(R)-2-methylmalate dehydratase large subunit